MEIVQDHYPEAFAHCFGCGRLNAHGHHVRTRWVDGEGLATFEPKPFHIALPGFVYGGLVASLIDCHSIGTAAAAFAEAQGVDFADAVKEDGAPRFVTGSLHVDFLQPTPSARRSSSGPGRWRWASARSWSSPSSPPPARSPAAAGWWPSGCRPRWAGEERRSLAPQRSVPLSCAARSDGLQIAAGLQRS